MTGAVIRLVWSELNPQVHGADPDEPGEDPAGHPGHLAMQHHQHHQHADAADHGGGDAEPVPREPHGNVNPG